MVEDAAAINELVVAVDTVVQGWSDSTEAELVDWWRLTDLAGNSWVVEDDSLAAYGVVIPHGQNAETDGYVDPAKTGLGLGSWLLRRAEERGRELGSNAALTWCLAPDTSARALFERSGYREVRRFYRMLVEHEDEPVAPEWSEGFRVSTFEPGDGRGSTRPWTRHSRTNGTTSPNRTSSGQRDASTSPTSIRRFGSSCAKEKRSPRCCAAMPNGAEQAGSVRSACAVRGAGAD